MTTQARTKLCQCCGDVCTEHKSDSNKQWAARKFCSRHCLNQNKDHSWKRKYFWDYVIIKDGCWGWSGDFVRDRRAYIRDHDRGIKTNAARVSWRLHYGEIPDGLYVLHKCDNPSCTNPEHLFLGTQSDNVRDMHSKGRHPRSPRKNKRDWNPRLDNEYNYY